MTRRSLCIATALTLLTAFSLPAQKKNTLSPKDQASITLGGSKITIDYSRPSLRGRKAVGGSLVPFNQVWRTGADEATKLTTPVDIQIGDLKVPAGSYALFTLPTEKGWTLIVNKTADQWGAFTYDKATDLGRVPMEMAKPASTVEKFTIELKPAGDKKAKLVLMWENTEASVDVTI